MTPAERVAAVINDVARILNITQLDQTGDQRYDATYRQSILGYIAKCGSEAVIAYAMLATSKVDQPENAFRYFVGCCKRHRQDKPEKQPQERQPQGDALSEGDWGFAD